MDSLASSQYEQLEVELVLRSGIFDKAPSLEKFFRYICELHFAGRADQIKEYTIAVEALGRSGDFDPKKDSIVRVEAHRLRRRLEEYYRGRGSSSAIQIVIPNGQYRPHFSVHKSEANSITQVKPTEIEGELAQVNSVIDSPVINPEVSPFRSPGYPPVQTVSQGSLLRWLLALTIFAAVSGGAMFAWRGVQKKAATSAPQLQNEKWTGSSNEPVPEEFRILTGYHGQPVIDRQGHTWSPDAYYLGGVSTPIPPERFIEGQIDPHFLKAQRSGRWFHYDIPLRQGTHELHLYFAEIEYGNGDPLGRGQGTRMFHVSINGVRQLSSLDPLTEAGAPNRVHERVFKDILPAPDGKLHIRFDAVTAPAILNAIEILPSPPGRIRPVRIVTQSSPVTDSDGRFWEADKYFCGGTLVFRQNVVVSPQEKALYHGERYGNFSYHIPLAPGKYRLILHFAETWFGTPESPAPPLDRRIFNVFANGVALLRNYQVVKDAGGSNRGIEKVFENLEPNWQGKLLLDFVPVKNYAEVNAIEVVEMK